jgi:transcriptional regulator, TetR family
MGLPGQPADITLFHYALDGLLLDQLTVPVDETVNPNDVVSVLAHRLLGN